MAGARDEATRRDEAAVKCLDETNWCPTKISDIRRVLPYSGLDQVASHRYALAPC